MFQPDGMHPPLELPETPGIEVVLRSEWDPERIDSLESLGVRVAILDLRSVETLEMRVLIRSLRAASAAIRVVVVTDAGDDAAAQLCLAVGAVAHLSRDLSPMTLLRAIHAAARGAPHLGHTGQRAMRRLQSDDPT